MELRQTLAAPSARPGGNDPRINPPAPSQAERLAEIVETALELPPTERTGFLQTACGEDAVLRAEVDSLLRYQDAVTEFIETPFVPSPPKPEPPARAAEAEARGGRFKAGERVGDYRVLSLVGEGGMGEVYLAEDTTLGRQVALKIVRRGLNFSGLHRRFRHEERILASLNHPGIARLYDGAFTPDGLPYFVMEYVEGERLDAYCHTHRLGTDERLALFRKVCAAVSYAHQHLVIHRDIKPANIRVTPEGEPKLLDFGIAKLLDPSTEQTDGQTLTFQGAMTPEYASPEQARGDAMTTASDVYSLGVIFYELLTGQRPYQLANRRLEEITRIICEEAVERPSVVVARPAATELRFPPVEGPERLRRRYAGDLDNIALTALRKEPARRYPSVGGFSEDVERHLEGLPVSARRDTWGYRSGKFLCRHRAAAVAVVLLLVTLLAGIVSTATQAHRATREARLATEQRDRAERRFEDVRRLSNALLFDIAPKIERLPGSTEARQVLLTQSLRYLDSLAGEAREEDDLQGELAAAYEKVGDLQGNPTNPNFIELTAALASYEKANAIRRALLKKQPANPLRLRALADNFRTLGDIRWQTGETALSLDCSRRALVFYTEGLAVQPDSLDLRLAHARANHDIGMTLSTNGKKADAMPLFQRAIKAAEDLRQRKPERTDILTLLANGHRQLGNALSWEDRQQEGEAEMARSLEIYEPLAAANSNDANIQIGLYQTYMMTSSVYEEVDNPRAHEFALKALAVIDRTVEKDPANLRAKQQQAKAYSRLGVTLANLGQAEESIRYLDEAVAGLRAITEGETRNRRFLNDYALALMRLGDAQRLHGNLPAALASLEKAVALFGELAAGNPSDNAALRNGADAHAFLADANRQLAAGSVFGNNPEIFRQQAREHYRLAVEALRQLKARDAFSKLDRSRLAALEADLQKME